MNSPEMVESEMLNAEKCHLPGIFTLDCRINVLNVHGTQQSIYLSESQKRLMQCLMNNISCKRRIIKFVWHECHQRIRDNNYHQLVYQFRNTLTRHQLPGNLLVTIPHRGLVLNTEVLLPAATQDGRFDFTGTRSSSRLWNPLSVIVRFFQGLPGLKKQSTVSKECITVSRQSTQGADTLR